MSRPPSEIARGDQHYANVAAHLDGLVYAFARGTDDRLERLDFAVRMFCDPTKSDGTAICPHVHTSTLANLLAVAIDRLAVR